MQKVQKYATRDYWQLSEKGIPRVIGKSWSQIFKSSEVNTIRRFNHCIPPLYYRTRVFAPKGKRKTNDPRSKREPKIHKTSVSTDVLFAMSIYPRSRELIALLMRELRCLGARTREGGSEESREQVKLTYNFMGIHSRSSSGLSAYRLIPLLSPRHAYIPRGIRARAREREKEKRNTRFHIDFED